jgi:competence protein ComEC
MQHSFWHKVPIVRILLAFATGVGTAMFYDINHWLALSYFGVFLLAFIGLPSIFKAFQQRWLSGIPGILMFYFAGILTHTYQNNLFHDSHFSYVPNAKTFLVRIDEEPIKKSHSYKMRAKVLQCTNTSNQLITTTGNVLLYISKNQLQRLPNYGDVLLLNANDVREVPPPKNPFEFDYKRYLAFNHIHHQTYLKQGQLVYTQINHANPVYKMVYAIQRYFREALHTYIKTPSEIGVAQALLYGFDDEIDEETMSAYANTGTLHVLAVSGMHVGIVFLIFSKLLWFMDKSKKMLLAKRLIIVVCLWAYSVLCGLSPSILRATVMFTFIITSQILNRRSNIYNTLAASCLTLLVVDANMLANVGFQLSYMAVLGIVFIQPMMYNFYVAPNWFVDQVWKISTVSVAAQIATSPIGILYFHQFPNCFLFSNLLIIPLTTAILYGCIVLLVMAKVTWLATWLGIAIKHTILFTNKLVMMVEDTPYAYVNGIQISILQSILLYVMSLCLIFYLMYQYKKLLQISLLALLCFLVLKGVDEFVHHHQKKLIIYSINQINAIQVVQGNTSKLILDNALRNDKQKFRFHLQQHIWQMGLQYTDTVDLNKNWQLITSSGKRILISGDDFPQSSKNIDVLVIRNMLHHNALKQIEAKQVLISGSVKKYHAQKMKDYYKQQNIPVHDVLYSGAFQLSL